MSAPIRSIGVSDTDISRRELELYKKLEADFVYYAPRALRIRTKEGAVKPFILNSAQMKLHEEMERQRSETGKVRVIVLKGRQQGMCYSPDMRVLTADYRWVRIGDLNVGERLVACDEAYGDRNAAGRMTERRVRTAVVEAKVEFRREAFEVALSNGTRLVATAEHRHLCRQRGGSIASWRAVGDLKVGDHIRAFCHGPDPGADSFEDGWFGGLLDGEGSFGANPGVRIALNQVSGPVLDRAKAYLDRLGIHYYELIDRRQPSASSKLGAKEVHCIRIDRCADVVRLLTKTRPTRFVNREIFVGKKLPNTGSGFEAWVRVESIEPVGEKEVVDIQTSEKTFICEGLVSHNSTYTQGRFFWRVTHRTGVRAFILTHEDAATNNLFSMTQRFWENCPPEVRPKLGASNAKEMAFPGLDSGYKVGTAGSRGVGRSDTIQYFHASEMAMWPNAEQHVMGALQAVPDMPGTEVVMESTSQGPSGVFYDRCMAAMRGETDYKLVFLPWFMQTEYERDVSPGFEMTGEEIEYAAEHGLSERKMAWRRAKMREMGGIHNFRREYPANVAEAFKVDAIGALWNRELLDSCRVAEAPEMVRVVVAVDPSGGSSKGNDEVGIVVCGKGVDGRGYVLEDASGRFSPAAWGERVVRLYDKYKADRIVAEKNFGGDMVEHTIRTVNAKAAYKAVSASRGKQQRAEPVVSLYEQGQVLHLGMLPGLEDEMLTWVAGKSGFSPGRLDAMVWAITDLLLGETGRYQKDLKWVGNFNSVSQSIFGYGGRW